MTPTEPAAHHDDRPFQPIAMLLAIVLPGAGHAFLGETRRAVLIACGVLGLFFGGILVGGVDVVDKKEDFVWFLGESLVGPIAFGTDYYHQHFLKVRGERGRLRSAYPYEMRAGNGEAVLVRNEETGEFLPLALRSTGEPILDRATGKQRMGTASDRPPNSKSVGRVNELGTLFAAIAGMLNLICIIDASFRHSVRPRRQGASSW